MSDPVRIEDARRRRDQRVPPHNTRAEEGLLGAMLVSRDAISAAVESGVNPEDFYKPAHGHIYEAVTDLFGRAQAVDVITVDEHLRRCGHADAAGPALVSLQAAGGIGNPARYARIVAEHALMRRLIHAAGTISEMAYSLPDDVMEAVDIAEQTMFDLRPKSNTPTAHALPEVLGEWLDVVEERVRTGGRIEHPTGWHDLDYHYIGGLHAGRLIVVAARPGVGKTSWAGALAMNVAGRGEPVLFVSIEMGREELAGRMVASQAGLVGSDIGRGQVTPRDWDRITGAMAPLGNLPLDIIDATPVTLLSVRTAIRRAVARRGPLGLVVIDYLQLMTGRGRAENRQVEVAELARGLKLLAKEMSVPVVVLAQLNRNVESRGDKRPMLSDLRESGEVENSADQVIFLYRDEVYSSSTEAKGIAELIVSKNRHGATGTVKVHADMASGRWLDLARREGI